MGLVATTVIEGHDKRVELFQREVLGFLGIFEGDDILLRGVWPVFEIFVAAYRGVIVLALVNRTAVFCHFLTAVHGPVGIVEQCDNGLCTLLARTERRGVVQQLLRSVRQVVVEGLSVCCRHTFYVVIGAIQQSDQSGNLVGTTHGLQCHVQRDLLGIIGVLVDAHSDHQVVVVIVASQRVVLFENKGVGLRLQGES